MADSKNGPRTSTPYDQIALRYEATRQPGEATVRELRSILATVPVGGLVLSAGCGTGQYEAALGPDWEIVGLDQSSSMLRIAESRVARAVLGDMMHMPFSNNKFDAVYFVQSLHHVGGNVGIASAERQRARRQAVLEAARVLRAGPIAIVQSDPAQNRCVWFWQYFPEALERKLVVQPTIEDIKEWLHDSGFGDVKAVPVDDPIIKGFYDIKAPLDPAFRDAFSEFSYLTKQEVLDGLSRLRRAIHDGSVLAAVADAKRRFRKLGGTVTIVSARLE